MLKRIRLGDEVDTYCGRCKEERTHQVEALRSDGRVERVVCRFCHSKHLYREQRQSGGVGTTAERTRRVSASSTAHIASLKPARAYSARETYEAGEQISHPKFGQGEVIEARQGKIDVRFGRERRTLLHAG